MQKARQQSVSSVRELDTQSLQDSPGTRFSLVVRAKQGGPQTVTLSCTGKNLRLQGLSEFIGDVLLPQAARRLPVQLEKRALIL